MIFHTPENHHSHNNLCLLACQHFENIRLFFQVTKPSLALLTYVSVLLMGYEGLCFTITRMCALGIWGVLSHKKLCFVCVCVCNHGREAQLCKHETGCSFLQLFFGASTRTTEKSWQTLPWLTDFVSVVNCSKGPLHSSRVFSRNLNSFFFFFPFLAWGYAEFFCNLLWCFHALFWFEKVFRNKHDTTNCIRKTTTLLIQQARRLSQRAVSAPLTESCCRRTWWKSSAVGVGGTWRF